LKRAFPTALSPPETDPFLLSFQKADRLTPAKGHRTSFDEAEAFSPKEVAAAEIAAGK